MLRAHLQLTGSSTSRHLAFSSSQKTAVTKRIDITVFLFVVPTIDREISTVTTSEVDTVHGIVRATLCVVQQREQRTKTQLWMSQITKPNRKSKTQNPRRVDPNRNQNRNQIQIEIKLLEIGSQNPKPKPKPKSKPKPILLSSVSSRQCSIY